ncbi:MAG: C40 family peptidase [Candidatus Zixiibacteriota bacterium]
MAEQLKGMTACDWYVHTALSYLGKPYIWGGDDPSGFDCSGFVIECLKSAGIVDEHDDYTADGLMNLFANHVVERPYRGIMLFQRTDLGQAKHVMICLDELFQIGASGGSSATSHPDDAWKQNAYVKIRPIKLTSGSRLIDPFAGGNGGGGGSLR